MPLIKDQAIILRHLDYSETSQVLACLMREHGARRLIAKGIKRGTKKGKPSATIDLLERGEIVFLDKAGTEAGLSVLTEWQQTEAHLGLRNSLAAWYAAQYAAEITAAATEEADPHPELFDALVALLETLAGNNEVFPGITMYQCAVVLAIGLWPDLSRCVICDRPAPPGRAGYYSATHSGLICRQCEPQIPTKQYVNAANLDALRVRTFQPAQAADVFGLLDETISVAIGRPTLLGPMVGRQVAPQPRDGSSKSG